MPRTCAVRARRVANNRVWARSVLLTEKLEQGNCVERQADHAVSTASNT